jgi:hypothetical protein
MRNPKPDPPRRYLRRFAWVVALLVAGAAFFFPDPFTDLVLRLTAALIFATGTVWPGLFRWAYLVARAPTYLLRSGFKSLPG